MRQAIRTALSSAASYGEFAAVLLQQGVTVKEMCIRDRGKNAKKYRKGEEYGSARWGTAKDIVPYIDPKFENNILLTQTERLTMTGRPKDPDRKSTRLNSSHSRASRMPSSA